MSSTSALARRLRAAIREHKAKTQSEHTPVPLMLYDPDGKRESRWLNGPLPDDYQGTVIYLPYNDRDDV